MRLIDADVLEKDLRAYADNKGPMCGEYELANGILKAVGRVQQAPTVDAVPVVCGEWIQPLGDKLRTCSNCRISMGLVDGELLCRFQHCPHCGAKMGGDSD